MHRFASRWMAAIGLMVLVVVCVVFGPERSGARTVYCVNCSNRFVQSLERATSVEQLATIMDQYSEDVMQTEQQVMMVKQNIEQLAYMLKNTKTLNRYTLRSLQNRFRRLGRLVGKVSRQKGEVEVLEDVYRTTYPNYGDVKGLVWKDTPEDAAERQRRWKDWSERVDQATMATFRLSGSQLSEIADSDAFDAHVQKLLNDPEGRMEALQAANQLAALQISETRSLRALLASSIQQNSQVDSKQEKESQTSHEEWKTLFSHTLDDVKMEKMRPGPSNQF
ncbi:P-type conjugative transfer protein TrbJ [Pseudodesulfovibrio tunisiensis]|uniref:P-type conjugative transfer protein TrbJ n=1 Tax=Pseudodesulfovibrio tunisiensis TaxID=463192 RepID=UPI001FB3A437|nr:P-type conjugative transfer protein TrbJ [Pseudodesulfovibrio tunisiensis]